MRSYSVPVRELENTDAIRRHRLISPDCLHYCPASAGGWGIVRVGLLVPESVLLLVAPAGCGRHGAIAALQLGFKERLFLLHVTETDIVTGNHMEKIPLAVGEILAKRRPRPKAMLICASCLDDLLGSDYDGLARHLEAAHDVPIRICHMDPIAMDGKTPPLLTIQRSVYDFLEPSVEKERAVNVMGSFVPVDPESEFYPLMAEAGIDHIRHVGACATLAEFQQMSRSAHNLLIRPAGRLAVEHLHKKLGTPYCYTPVSYTPDIIARNYGLLEQALNVRLNTHSHREAALDKIREYGKILGSLTVAVGSTANASPFELARALCEFGFQVRYIIADQILDIDREHIQWLRRQRLEIKVFTNLHPTMVALINEELAADVAIGFDAGYFCRNAVTVPLGLERQPFGFQAATFLLNEMHHALEHPRDHREQMYASGMVL